MASRTAQRSRLLAIALAASVAFAALWHAEAIQQVASDWLNDSQNDSSTGNIDSRATPAFRAATIASIPPTFSMAQTWSSPITAQSIAVGDFNGDGRDDLAAVASEDPDYSEFGRLYLFMQNPDGTLGAATTIDLPVELYRSSTRGLTVADLNEDGRSDLVLGQGQFPALHYLLSQAGGGFAWRRDDWSNLIVESEVLAGDIDGDGHVDLVMQRNTGLPESRTRYSAQNSTFFGDGQGNFPRHRSEASLEIDYATALGHLNADGRLDLLSSNAYGHPLPHVRINDGSGGWLPAVGLGNRWDSLVSGVAVSDFTGDARQDAVAFSYANSSKVEIYPQLPDGSLQAEPLIFPAGSSVGSARIADLNGDGRQDLVHLDGGWSVPRFFYYLPDQYGLGNPIANNFDVGDNEYQFISTDVAIGDLNGDGVKDVALATHRHGLIVSSGKLTPFSGPGGLPGAPTLQQIQVLPPVEGTLREVDVTVGAPGDDGGSTIIGYSVYAVPGDVVDADAGSSAAVHRMKGLGDNRTYAFYARAINAAGLGPPSALSAPVVLGTPVDPDADPKLTVYLWPKWEGDLGSTTFEVSFALDKPAPAGGSSFDLSTSNGTATAGLDYVAKTVQDISFAAGERYSNAFTFEILGDQIVEGDEIFHLDISDPRNLTVVSPQLDMVIQDEDVEAARLSIGDVAAVEGNSGDTLVTIPIKLSQPLADAVTFDISSIAFVATPGVDYESLQLTGQRIEAGQTSTVVQVVVHGDTVYEYDEGIYVEMRNIVGAEFGMYAAFVRILNDDPLPTLSIADIAVLEGDQFSAPARFQAKLSGTLPYDVFFAATTEDGTATEGSDYLARYIGSLYIPAGQTIAELEVPIVPDTRLEPGETFSVRLENGWRVQIADAIGVATIINDDAANGLAVDDLSVAEGGVAEFTIRLSEPSAQPVTFDAWTTQGTAVAGADYQASQAEALVIPAGSTSVKFSVPTVEDGLVEDNESFVLNLGNVSGAQLTDAQGLARIINDDVAVLSIVSDVSALEGNDEYTMLVFEVRLSQPVSAPVVFEIDAVDTGSAERGGDYAADWKHLVRIDPGRTRYVYLTYVLSDTLPESDETFEVRLTGVKGAVLGDGVAVATIIDEDGDVPAARGGRGLANKPSRVPLKQRSH